MNKINQRTMAVFSGEQKRGIAKYLVEHCCELHKFSDTSRKYCEKKYRQRCTRNGNIWTDYMECPKECVHHPSNINIACDGEKCAVIKKQLKEIENNVNTN